MDREQNIHPESASPQGESQGEDSPAHTPLPWHAGEMIKHTLGLRILPVYGPDGELVCDCEYASDAPVSKACAEANVALIVRSANAHEAMVGAAHWAIGNLISLRADLPLMDTSENHQRIMAISAKLRAALALAGG